MEEIAKTLIAYHTLSDDMKKYALIMALQVTGEKIDVDGKVLAEHTLNDILFGGERSEQ